MKTLIILFLLSISAFGASLQQDSSAVKKDEAVSVKNKEGKIDQTGEGVSGEKMQKRKGKDVFIDKDGDGICDSRQGGMSFNKMRKRAGMGAGKGDGKGDGKGMGGRR